MPGGPGGTFVYTSPSSFGIDNHATLLLIAGGGGGVDEFINPGCSSAAGQSLTLAGPGAPGGPLT